MSRLHVAHRFVSVALVGSLGLLGSCAGGESTSATSAPITAFRGDPVSTTETGIAADASFPCDAWMHLEAQRNPDAEPPESADAEIAALEDVAEHPSAAALDLDVELVTSYLVAVSDLVATHGPDLDDIPFDQIDPATIALMNEGGDALAAIFATNATSLLAHASCEGAGDPHFVLACAAYSGFSNVLPPSGGGAPPPPIEDEIQQRMETPGFPGDRIVHRPLESDPDGFELATLDGNGVATSLSEVVPDDGRWTQLVSYSCGAPSGTGSFTPVTIDT